MKKFFALMIALMMMFSFAAFAEEAVNVEEAYEGTWVMFESDGFEIYLPSDWVELEISEEIAETGIYYAVASPDGAYTASIAWSALDAELDLAGLEAELATAYPGATAMTIGNVEAVCYADGEADVLAFALLDQVDLGMYMFNFTPASDADMQVLATLMMTSIRPIEAAATEE